MEIDLNAFEYNIRKIQEYVGKDVKIIPVIKANGYGTYINKCIDLINKFEIVALATIDEGKELRQLGYKNEIFILNQPYKDEIEKIDKYKLTIGVSSNNFIEALGSFNSNFNVHVEIGTGMGRTGINPKRVKKFINTIKNYDNIKIDGIYTHLSSADIDIEYTEKQLSSFNIAVFKAKEILEDLKYIHASASNGILNFKDSYYNAVRPGMIMYGYKTCNDTFNKINLKPVSKLKSKIILVKKVEKNTSIGYSRSYITTKDTDVATVPMGYADGLRRNLSNKGYVIINGKKAPIIGNICMDSFMVDVTGLDANEGDNVYIWDNENITLDEVAEMCDTINYEIISTISYRVPRVFNYNRERK